VLEQIITVILEFTRSGQRVKIQLPQQIAESAARGGFQPMPGARILAIQADSVRPSYQPQ